MIKESSSSRKIKQIFRVRSSILFYREKKNFLSYSTMLCPRIFIKKKKKKSNESPWRNNVRKTAGASLIHDNIFAV